MSLSQGLLEKIFRDQKNDNISELNELMLNLSGIKNFFKNNEDYATWNEWYKEGKLDVGAREYGDYQTPIDLADRVCKLLINKGINPSMVVEPTFGKGNFIQAAIKNFDNIKKIYGVEIQEHYEMFLKKTLLENGLINNLKDKNTTLEIHRDDFFQHEFPEFLFDKEEELLFLGNPPWVTIAELSKLNSINIPEKSNFKKHKGLDAITGKANFDVSEYIIIKLIEMLNYIGKGTIAILCKNSVTKNIVHSLPSNEWNITTLEQYNFSAKEEFNVNTEASLFLIKVGEKNKNSVEACDIYKLSDPLKKIKTYGWVKDKFVSNVENYQNDSLLDNKSSLVWRSGVKHDSSKIMELKVTPDYKLENGLKEIVQVEEDLIFNLLKSSDLKGGTPSEKTRKKVIVTQRKVGEETSYIKSKYPKLWNYLVTHRDFLDNRKSSIYKDKPSFSIFGIGSYSFASYKVAISGMYKKPNFSLIVPSKNKPVMLDDTCYFLSFDNYKDALFTFLVLNSKLVQEFLKSLVFMDSKRPYTKDILMRIDILEASKQISFSELILVTKETDVEIPTNISEDDYNNYIEMLSNNPKEFFKDNIKESDSKQIILF